MASKVSGLQGELEGIRLEEALGSKLLRSLQDPQVINQQRKNEIEWAKRRSLRATAGTQTPKIACLNPAAATLRFCTVNTVILFTVRTMSPG